MPVFDTKWTCQRSQPMSAFGGIADIATYCASTPALFRFYVRGPHHFSPLLGIAHEQCFKFGGSAPERRATELTKPRIEGWIRKARINLFVEQFHDLGGSLSTCRNTEPNARLITRDEFADCGISGNTGDRVVVDVTAYVRMAQRRSLWISVSLAFIAWLATTLVLASVRWTALSASVVNLSVFALCLWIVKPFRLVPMPPTTRPWNDFVVRAGMVTLLVGAVVTLSFRIGPAGSGVLAVFPVIYASIMVILHRRVGGPATATVLANAAVGVSVAWNAGLYFLFEG